MSRRIGLIGCVKKKHDVPTLASDLYISSLFKGRRSYVERSCDEWWILSAKHGLVSPHQVLQSYDVALKNMGRAQRREWSLAVLAQFDMVGGLAPGDSVEMHAGSEYRNFGLVDGLRRKGYVVDNPTEGLTFGEQLRFYKSMRGEAGPGG